MKKIYVKGLFVATVLAVGVVSYFLLADHPYPKNEVESTENSLVYITGAEVERDQSVKVFEINQEFKSHTVDVTSQVVPQTFTLSE